MIFTEECGHERYMDNRFSSPDLLDDLIKKKINRCVPVGLITKAMPQGVGDEKMKMMWH